MGRPRLNKRFQFIDGIEQSSDPNDAAFGFDSGYYNAYNAGVNAPGLIASVNGIVTTPSGQIIGKPANQPLLNAWRTIYTWNVPALGGVYGSTNSVAVQDAAMSGAAIGDAILVSPIGSVADTVHFQGFCFSAGAVQLRAWQTGTVGAMTPGNVPLKLVDWQI